MKGSSAVPPSEKLNEMRIWCLRDAEHDVVHGDDRVHKRDGVDVKIRPDFIVRKDVRTV